MIRRAVALLFLAAACTPTALPSPTPTMAPTPSASAFTTTTPAPTPTAAMEFRTDAAAAWPAVVVEALADGTMRRRTEAGATALPTPCVNVHRLRWHRLGVLVWCGTATLDREQLRLVDVTGSKVTTLTEDVLQSWPADLSPDGSFVAAFRAGACQPQAPVCQTRVVLIELATGAEREILGSEYHLGATLEYTSLGLTLFQPLCAEAGCTSFERSGTFVWDGAAFKRYSDFRFVAASSGVEIFENTKSFADRSAERLAVMKRGTEQKTLTTGGAKEIPLGFTPAGDVLVYRLGSGLSGTLVRYDLAGRIVWQADVAGESATLPVPQVVRILEPSGLVLYDLDRMLRFPIAARITSTVGPR